MLEGRPLKGYELERLKEFLKSMDLDYDTGIEYSICLEDEDYRIIAAGSVEENVLKCIAISPDHQGEGLSGTIISHLTQYEFEKGRSHLLMYTKPKNQAMFDVNLHLPWPGRDKNISGFLLDAGSAEVFCTILRWCFPGLFPEN